MFIINFQGHVSLIDFNPFGTITDGLLFTWQELLDMDVNSNMSLVCLNLIYSNDNCSSLSTQFFEKL